MADVTEIVQNSQNTDRDFHMFCFSESRLNDHIDDKEVSIAGFHIIRKDPLDGKETGLIVYPKEGCLTSLSLPLSLSLSLVDINPPKMPYVRLLIR